MQFETERCEVRSFTEADLPAVMACHNDLAWMRFQNFKNLTKEQYRERLLPPRTLEQGTQLAVVCRKTGALLGDFYVKIEGTAAFLGYTAVPQYARKGYLTEAVHGLLPQLKQLGVQRAIAEIDPENVASIALAKKAGFAFSEQLPDVCVYEWVL